MFTILIEKLNLYGKLADVYYSLIEKLNLYGKLTDVYYSLIEKLNLYGKLAAVAVFTLNFLPYKPTRPVSSNIYRPTINSTGPNFKTTLMTINSNHQNSKHDDVPNSMLICQLCIR